MKSADIFGDAALYYWKRKTFVNREDTGFAEKTSQIGLEHVIHNNSRRKLSGQRKFSPSKGFRYTVLSREVEYRTTWLEKWNTVRGLVRLAILGKNLEHMFFKFSDFF